jgi:hypothetical protein
LLFSVSANAAPMGLCGAEFGAQHAFSADLTAELAQVAPAKGMAID